MSHLHKKIATITLLTLLFFNILLIFSTSTSLKTPETQSEEHTTSRILAQSELNLTIPYVDAHYGYADGIIDPWEYAYSFTDPVTGVTVYMEHNSTFLYLGLNASTSGWVAIGWKNPNATYETDGLNNTDLIFGYAPGTPYEAYPRVTGNEVVAVHYKLFLRNGTLIEEGAVPDGTGDTPLNKERLLEAYKEAIIGMRVGEIRHFVIPAEEGYTTESDELYGEDLEYVIELKKVGPNDHNPAESSAIVYSEQHGINTFKHVPDEYQNQVVAANASDNGKFTQLEYIIRMNSTDPDDIPLLNATTIPYPFIIMFGADEDINSLPIVHSDWANPLITKFIPNSPPLLISETPKENDTLSWIVPFELNATDEGIVRSAGLRIDNESWISMKYDFKTDLWTHSLDVSEYDAGIHTIWFNATDASNKTSIISVNVTILIPYNPLLGAQISASRTISTQLYHGVKITDEFTITNVNALPIGAIEVYLPARYTSNFLSIEGEDKSDTPLKILKIDNYNGMYQWRVYFAEPIERGESYTFTLTMYLHSLQKLINFDNNLYSLEFLKYPVVPFIITRLSLSMGFRSGDSLYSGTNPEGVYYNIGPMTIETFEMVIKSFTPDIRATRTTRIEIDPWGWLHYTETIHLENVGPNRENDLTMKFPAYISNIKIYDRVGILAGSQPKEYEWNETLTQRINLKSDRFGEKGFWPGYKYTFNVEYTIHLPSYQHPVACGNYLEISMANFADLLVTEHTIDLIIPSAISITEVSGGYRLLYGIFDSTLRYTIYNTTEKNQATLFIVYQITPGIFARPFVFVFIVGIVAAAYVSLRKMKLPVSEEIAAETERLGLSVGAPSSLLSNFARTYSRKTALKLDLEKLESARKRGKVSKREFMSREHDIKSELEKIDRELISLKEELISYGSKYRDIVAQLELQEERMESAKAGLRQLLARKRKQKITRAVFEKTREEHLKKIKQAVTAIDRILLGLQEEAGEI